MAPHMSISVLLLGSSLRGGALPYFKNVGDFNVTWALGMNKFRGTNAYPHEYLN